MQLKKGGNEHEEILEIILGEDVSSFQISISFSPEAEIIRNYFFHAQGKKILFRIKLEHSFNLLSVLIDGCLNFTGK